MKKAKSQADRIIKLSELTEGTWVHKLAKANIKFNGFYAYIDASNNKKTFVEA